MKLTISSLGMKTSLGGVVGGAAAQRAALSRPSLLDTFYVPSGDTHEPLVVHRALPDGDFSSGIDSWLQLALEATRDLLGHGNLPDPGDERFWRRTAVMAAVPLLEVDRFAWARDEPDETLRRALLGRLVESLALPVSGDQLFVFPNGPSAVARALAAARSQIESRRFDRTLIVAIDSWIDTQSLFWLASRDRLRTGDNPDGLSPSEAAASLLVEGADACSKRGGDVAAILQTEVISGSAHSERVDAATAGRHLARVIRQALDAVEPSPAFAGDIYLDLNGERYRGTAWGHAQVHLKPRLDFAGSRVVLPCSELGDTGAASAAIAICLGARSFARSYARGPRALVCSIAERGDASAIVIAAPGTSSPSRGR
jgi:3-oxoacyl-[acyl-carrier-protein] synthase-1